MEGKTQPEDHPKTAAVAASEPVTKDLPKEDLDSIVPNVAGSAEPATVPAISGDGSLAKEVVARIEATEGAGAAGVVVSPLASHPPESKISTETPLAAVTEPELAPQPIAEPKPDSVSDVEPATQQKSIEPQESPKDALKQSEPAPKKPGQPAPLAERIALPTAAITPTTETTVTGGSQGATSPTREKDGSKVSSWLKSKLGRRSSKAATTSAPETSSTKPTISAPKDPKVFVGAANLGAPDTNTTRDSSDAADSSMREVALAGRNAGPVDAPVVPPTDYQGAEGTHRPSAAGASSGFAADDDNSDSASISSLSSDEDTRGRSNTRLADQIQHSEQRSQPQAQTEAPVAPATTAQKDFAAAGVPGSVSRDRGTSSEEFVEARDQVELEPPDKSVFGRKSGEGKKSDSPVRDSKFVEQL